MIIGAGDIAQALIPRLIKKNLGISLFNRSSTEINNIKSKSLKKIENEITEVDAIVIAAPSETPFFSDEALKRVSKRLQVFDLAIPRNINFKMTGTNIKLINLDELSEKISTNLDSRKDASFLESKLVEIFSLNSSKFISLMLVPVILKFIFLGMAKSKTCNLLDTLFKASSLKNGVSDGAAITIASTSVISFSIFFRDLLLILLISVLDLLKSDIPRFFLISLGIKACAISPAPMIITLEQSLQISYQPQKLLRLGFWEALLKCEFFWTTL